MAIETIGGVRWDTAGLSSQEILAGRRHLQAGGDPQWTPGTDPFKAKQRAGTAPGVPGMGFESAQALTAGQAGREEEFLGRYRAAQAAQPTYTQMAETIGRAPDIDIAGRGEAFAGLQEALIGAEQRLTALPEQIRGETAGFGISAPRLAKRTALAEEPLRRDIITAAQEASKAGVRLTGAQQALTQRLGYAALDLERQLQPYAQEAELLGARATREMTGYTVDKQSELSLLLEKMQQEGLTTRAEADRLNQLAMEEQSHLNRLEETRAQIGFQTEEDIRQSLALRRPTGTTGGLTAEQRAEQLAG